MSKMRKRKTLIAFSFLFVAIFGLGAIVNDQMRNRCPIRYENFDKIQRGMSKAEVEAILGCEPGNYSTGPVHAKFTRADGSTDFFAFNSPESSGHHDWVSEYWNSWHGDRGYIQVEYDRQTNTVTDMTFIPGRRIPSEWWMFMERNLGFDW
jgi:hypothetical protein